MKKIVSVLLVLVIIGTLLTACGTSALVGTWTATIEGAEGQMILHKDGTGEIVSHDATRPCTWEASGNTLTVVQEIDDLPYTFLNGVTYTVKGRTLTITSQSGNTLVFKRKK